ncbi:MAG: Uma2 family endonuclease [Lachnospiraceae bacterium]|nr:Uma2 family endonuclease [Lachnospiraceae bacterium]
MGKDYTDMPDGVGKIQGVGEGAPAYQAERFLQLVPEPEKMTLEDYLALPDDRRVEMIDGVFYDMAAPTLVHQLISMEIWKSMKEYVEKNGGDCVPFAAPVDVQLFHDDKTIVQPDVFVVCDRDKLIKQRVLDVPDLIVEVVSPGSLKMDTRLKLEKYKQAGVREYWIVFPEEKKVLVYLFEKAKEAADIVPKEYTFANRVPVGIWDDICEVDFGEIYEQCSFLYE